MKIRNLFLLICCSGLLVSCTITSRKYMPGYSIDWVSNTNSTKAESSNSPRAVYVSPIATYPLISNISNTNEARHKSNIQLNPHSISYNSEKHLIIDHVKSISCLNNGFVTIPISLNDSNINNKKELTTLPKAKASLTFSLLAWAIVVVFVFAILFLIPLSTLGFFLILSVAGVGDILGFIFGIIAIHTYKKEPSKYFGLNWAILGIVFSAIILTLIILLFILLK